MDDFFGAMTDYVNYYDNINSSAVSLDDFYSDYGSYWNDDNNFADFNDYDDYDDYSDFYYADELNAALATSTTINDGVTVTVFGYDSANIWLSTGIYGSAQNINAAYSYGTNILVGDYGANLILAGMGDTNLWGGQDFANDVLVGGLGTDTFICGKTEGSDSVTQAGANDIVRLYDATLSDIVATAADGAGNVGIRFAAGNVLTVNCADFLSPTFALADGSRYVYNRVESSWQRV